MSYTAKKRVNLEFISGQLEEDIAVENENETLGAFIEAALIRLEEQRLIQLPDSDEPFTVRKDFRVTSENDQLMDINMPMSSNAYMLSCWRERYNPTLMLNSSIFEDTLNRPSVPSRNVSMGTGSVSGDVMKSLVGRAMYDGPVCSRINAAQMNTSLPDDYIDRLFMQDDDVYSMSSFAPSTTPTELDNVSHRAAQRAPPPVPNRSTSDNQSINSGSSETQSQISSDSLERTSHVAAAGNCGTTQNSSETSHNSQTIGGKLESIRRKPNVKKSHRRPSANNVLPLRRSLSPQDVIKEGEILNVSPTNETIHEVLSPQQRGGHVNMETVPRFKKSTVSSSRMYEAVQSFDVEFVVPSGEVIVEIQCLGSHTIEQIKQDLWGFMREVEVIQPLTESQWDPEKYCLTYDKDGNTYELYDEQQILQTSELAHLWQYSPSLAHQVVVQLREQPSSEEKKFNLEIGGILDMGLYQLDFSNNSELDTTRRKLVSTRQQAIRYRNPILYSMEPELSLAPLPSTLQDKIYNNQVVIHVHTINGNKREVQIDTDITADQLLYKSFPDDMAVKEMMGLSQDSDVFDFVLKVAGRKSYIIGNNKIIDFSHIRRCISQGDLINLYLVKKVDPSEDFPPNITDRYLIDEQTGVTGSHQQLSSLSKDHSQVFTMSLWDIRRQFRVRVVGLDNLRDVSGYDAVYIVMGMYHGGCLLCPAQTSPKTTARLYPRWNQWFVFNITVRNIPKAARLCIGVYGYHSDKKKKSKKDTKEEDSGDVPLHWINMQILDHKGLLRQGLLKLNLWPVQNAEGTPDVSLTSPMGSTAVNPDDNHCVSLYIELDGYAHPVACPNELGGVDEEWNPGHKVSSMFAQDLESTILSDPLKQLTDQEKELCWTFRHHCATRPEALPKFLLCVNWADLDQVLEVHRLLKVWCPLTLPVALELLDYHYADEKVRTMAVKAIERLLTNDELHNFLLQLVQVLKFEPYHGSALASFLLKRALESKRIGHYFFWYLRAEMETPAFKHRFGVLLEGYLRGCGLRMFNEIKQQYIAVNSISKTAQEIKSYAEKYSKNGQEFARQELGNTSLPSSFSCTTDPCITVGRLDVSSSKYMDSKKKPLWLEFSNADHTVMEGRVIKLIAKHGDDLRQDMLTIQMLTIMDKLWQESGLDLRLIPYGTIATGYEKGVIEVVQNAETVAKIQLQHGGLLSSFKEDPIYKWLKEHNPREGDMDKAKETFMLSCAGYCVATYVLGIGDRHNDNIMVTTSGNLFHIDFGHFLGKTKKFMGVSRERAPFVLTPDFVYIMGGKNGELFRQFEEAATKAYLVIRQNANLIITLFSMMKSTGIPELRSVEDIDYLRKVLLLNKTQHDAAEDFKAQIQACLRLSFSTQLNFYVHIWAHKP